MYSCLGVGSGSDTHAGVELVLSGAQSTKRCCMPADAKIAWALAARTEHRACVGVQAPDTSWCAPEHTTGVVHDQSTGWC